jgi:hypothetical protein
VHLLPFQSDDVNEQSFGKPMLPHDRDRQFAAVLGEFEVPVVSDDHQSVAFHARHRLAHGGAALLQTLRYAGAQRYDTLLLELEDGAQVHLGSVDEIVHACPLCSPYLW